MIPIGVGYRLCTQVFTTKLRAFMTLNKNPFENIDGKEENAGDQHFLLSPQMFTIPRKSHFSLEATFILSSENAFN